ncbi:MAG TPA: hypothetical protein VM689_25890 [Aliidongia sp.]|nr:hypothetical protein [Aliidongia sp.]
MSKTDLPPVPPASRPRREDGAGETQISETMPEAAKPTGRNLGSQGRQGNIHQNTTHQGHQQDR